MKNKNLKDKIDEIFKKDDRFWDEEREVLLRNTISDYAEKFDEKFLEMLLSDKTAKEHFFKKVGEIMVFDKEKFLAYINNKDFLENSYTKFTQNIGLTDEGQFLKSAGKVILHWPYKDCILEGGQTKEDVKRNEIFFNEILEKDEIDVLLKPKVFSKFEKYSLKNGKAKGEKLEKFTRDENGTIKDNLIIKGNNLIVLHSLKEEFAGKVKLIYIDPPYNTGNDGFKYNDNFNHSSWLTFMKNRLEAAKDLLADDGVIFVQCDDNEQAYLKVLMDEIFGRDNFVSNLVWKGRGGRQDSKFIAQIHETIIFYSKNTNSLGLNKKVIEDKSSYSLDDEKRKLKYKLQLVRKWGSNSKRKDRPNLFYSVNFNGKKIFPIHSDGSDGCWRWSKKKLEKAIKDDLIVAQEKNGEIELYEKIFETDGKKEIIFTSWIEETFFGKGAIHMEELFGTKLFDYPKPEELIKYIFEIATKENDLILDFFAGSGTSGAVAHKMGRQYILVEQMDYIKDLPEARIKKVIEGEQGGISKAVNWKGGGEFVYMEMKEFNQEFLSAIKKAKSEEDLKKIYEDIKEKAFLSYRFT
ncbi:site-specific DNA-methyltransferase, partial [Candidatus Parcubacteria bacterium]|nr:site-specific DNA-methyltransferase [Candidatus Parcubacteria bacterium]